MTLTGLDQLWVADITYIRLRAEFVYLAVILDAYSRRVIGWALGRTLEDTLTLRALRMALDQRRPAPGLVHHSDRGVQYASGDYTDLLRAHGIVISMSRKGNPYDNAKAESFMKTLKYEEVFRQDYRDLAGGARRHQAFPGTGLQPEAAALGARLSSACRIRVRGARRPGRSGEAHRNRFGNSGVCMSFSRHEEIYRPRESRNVPGRPCTTPPLIATMSFQLAIPRQVALQQSPPPLHQPSASC